MSKKIKKKQKKLDKKASANNLDAATDISSLKEKIVKLEKELNKRDKLIVSLQEKIKVTRPRKEKKEKGKKQGIRSLFSRQTNGIGVMQKQARQRHGFLLHRYEYYLGVEQDKSKARMLAGQDLIDKFGAEAAYSEEELEHILS